MQKKVLKHIKKNLKEQDVAKLSFEKDFFVKFKSQGHQHFIKADLYFPELKAIVQLKEKQKLGALSQEEKAWDNENKLLIIEPEKYLDQKEKSFKALKKELLSKKEKPIKSEPIIKELNTTALMPVPTSIAQKDLSVVEGGRKPLQKNINTPPPPSATEMSTETEGWIEELIGKAPSWLLRSGISMVALVTLVLMSLAYFIHYPDTINSQGEIITDQPVLEIKPKIEARIDQAYVTNNESVSKGQNLFYLFNTTDLEDLKEFKSFVKKYKGAKNKTTLLKLRAPKNLKLGALNQVYAQFILKFEEYKLLLKQNTTNFQISTIQDEISKTNQINKSLGNESTIFDAEYELIVKDFERHKALYKEGVISLVELEKVEQTLAQYQRQKEGNSIGAIQNQIKIENLKQQTNQLRSNYNERLDQSRFSLNELMSAFDQQLLDWEETHYIKAEIDGKVELHAHAKKQKLVSPSQSLGFVIPIEKTSNEKYLLAYAPAQGIGKVAIGQRTLIKLDAFPYKEFGIIEAKVSEISDLAIVMNQNRFYEIRIDLDQNLVTDQGKEIKFQPNLSATATIITESRNILERIFENILYIINKD